MARWAKPSRRGPRLTYGMAAVWSVVTILLGYAVLDVADAAPGPLTVRPLPPPAQTEYVATRTLPPVPPPTLPPQVDAPLPALRDSAIVGRDGQGGEVLLDQRGDELRIPASTTKLLSAAAIGRTFAPDA